MTAVSPFERGRVAVGSGDGGDSAYSDRLRTPAETCALVAPVLAGLGITRVARQTGLDRLGIPVFSALRPNARTLASSQGKGIDDESARASATMEAIEFAFAEKPALATVETSIEAARAQGFEVLDVTRFLPIGESPDPAAMLRFVTGRGLVGGAPVLVPYDLVDIDETAAQLPGLARSSNGLASGNTRDEAVLHGLLELIERDATTLARLNADGSFGRTVGVEALTDRVVEGLARRIRAAGFELWLFDQTSDLGIPVFQAVIGDPARGYWRHFDLATGFGCHPNAARAAIRAITEAAQTRVTNIAGARDDFRPAEYRLEAHGALLQALQGRGEPGAIPAGLPLGLTTASLLRHVLVALQQAGCDEPVVVDLGGDDLGVAVARVFVRALEDRSTNRNWRPGRRAIHRMLRQ